MQEAVQRQEQLPGAGNQFGAVFPLILTLSQRESFVVAVVFKENGLYTFSAYNNFVLH